MSFDGLAIGSTKCALCHHANNLEKNILHQLGERIANESEATDAWHPGTGITVAGRIRDFERYFVRPSRIALARAEAMSEEELKNEQREKARQGREMRCASLSVELLEIDNFTKQIQAVHSTSPAVQKQLAQLFEDSSRKHTELSRQIASLRHTALPAPESKQQCIDDLRRKIVTLEDMGQQKLEVWRQIAELYGEE